MREVEFSHGYRLDLGASQQGLYGSIDGFVQVHEERFDSVLFDYLHPIIEVPIVFENDLQFSAFVNGFDQIGDVCQFAKITLLIIKK